MTATIACWVILTYCFPVWQSVPYIFIGGPVGSGKTRLFDLLARTVFRPLFSSNMTSAALYRSLHSQGGALLLDEAERLREIRSPDVAELLSMLLAGYRAGGCATRLEPVGDTFRTVTFQVYGPKAVGCVQGVPPALASRCIPVMMFRAPPGSDKPKRRIDGDPDTWQRLRDDLHALALGHGPDFLALAGRSDVCPAGIDGRHYELWQPLLSLAAWVESHGMSDLLGVLQQHALATIDSGRDEAVADCDETLLRMLAEAVQSGERPEPGELLKRAQEAEPAAFKNWSARAVTSHLKRYGVPTPKKSMGRRVFRDVTVDHLQRIQDAYGIDLDLPPRPSTVPDEAQDTQ